MSKIVFGGVSPRSLGDLLKGYGIMAILGEEWPDTLFWWDDAFHLVAEGPWDSKDSKGKLLDHIKKGLPEWAKKIASTFKPVRRSTENNVQREPSKLVDPGKHDEFEPDVAAWARAIALPVQGRSETEPHPLFPAHGQEGSGDYFSQIEKALGAATKPPEDLAWSLFAEGSPCLRSVLDSGYLFFPEPMKRYATGITKWEQDANAVVTGWCFVLAVRGATLLRGSLRRLRWGRRSYPAFPFVFEGSMVELGGKFFRNVELHLPTWIAAHPRTLGEFEMQVRQFQARLSGRGFAATAAEFRAAVVGRGVGAAFDTYHRFVLEGRRPGQQQPMRQGIPRGLTRVGGTGGASAKLRLMLAPLAETGWFDQFTTDRLRAARGGAEQAVHRAVDEPGLEAYRGVLEALWGLNRAIILPGGLRREFEDQKRTPRPLPPLPARHWVEALRDGLDSNPAYRLGLAIGSILGVKVKETAVGPVLEHMLPVKYDWSRERWEVPDPPPSRPLRWSGLNPLVDFRNLLWFRWLDSEDLGHLPFSAARYASLDDIAALLRGEVDVREVHRLAGLFALLDWQGLDGQKGDSIAGETADPGKVPPAYAVLRLWLELGIRPAPDSRPPRDGEVIRLVNTGQPAQVKHAVARALSRLRVNGLPWPDEPRPQGKAVARFEPEISDDVAARLAVAILVPISSATTRALSRRLWVPTEEKKEVMA